MTTSSEGRMETIFSGKDMDVLCDDHGGADYYVTFTSFGTHKVGFGQALFAKRGISAVYFVSKWNHWWLSPEMDVALPLVIEWLKRRSPGRVIAYGASMGGYAAALYARRLRARTVLLIAPQFSIDSAKVPFEKRWRREASVLDFGADDMARQLSRDIRHVVILDPVGDDIRHLALFEAHVPVERVAIIGGGHTPGLVLREVGLLSQLTFDLSAGDIDRRLLRQTVRNRRRGSVSYLLEMASRCLRRRPATAYRLQKMALALEPDHAVACLHGANMAFAAGEIDQAIAWALKTTCLLPQHPAAWRTLSKIYSRLGYVQTAVQTARRAVSLREADADLWRVLMEAELQAGDSARSREAAQKALALAPDYAPTRQFLTRLDGLSR